MSSIFYMEGVLGASMERGTKLDKAGVQQQARLARQNTLEAAAACRQAETSGAGCVQG
jgi:hypothetical protein